MEFAFVASCLVPLIFGTIVLGLNLARAIQVTQVSRDAGHMYARAVEFSDPNNKNIIVRLALGLNMTATGGSAVVILSKVTYIAKSDCDAAKLTGTECANMDQHVFTHRIVVGNAAVRASAFGTPDPSLIDTKGNVANYLKDPRARANGFGPVLTLQSGQEAYVSEAYVKSSDYGLPGYTTTGVYARTIF